MLSSSQLEIALAHIPSPPAESPGVVHIECEIVSPSVLSHLCCMKLLTPIATTRHAACSSQNFGYENKYPFVFDSLNSLQTRNFVHLMPQIPAANAPQLRHFKKLIAHD